MSIFLLGLFHLGCFAAAHAADTQASGGAAASIRYCDVPLAGVGCIGGYKEPGDTDPENTPARISTSSSSYGWDYRNRSLVVDLGLRKTVNRIRLLDTVTDNHGTASNLNKSSVRIYFSDDNRHYVRYCQNYDLSIKGGDGLTCGGKPVFDVLDFDKLAVRARYIKLNTTYGGESSNFVFANIQTGIQVFQLASEHFEIRDIQTENRILTWGENKVYANLAVPEGRRARIVLALSDGTHVCNEHSRAVVSGKQPVDYPVASLDPGDYELVGKLQSENGTVEAETRLPLKVFSRQIRGHNGKRNATEPSRATPAERPAAGEILLMDDFRPILTAAQSSFADYRSLMTGKRKSLAILNPTSAKIHLPACGWCAIYVGLLENGGGVTLQLEGAPEHKTCMPGSDPCDEIARVTGKPALNSRHEGDVIRDVFVRYANLKGQSVSIKPSDPAKKPGLAYIKIMCLTPRQVELVSGQRDISAGKRYIYTEDGFQNWSQRDIVKDVGKFSGHPEVEAYSWGIGGSAMYYPTKIGSVLGELSIFPRELDRAYVDSLRDLLRAGRSPIGMAVEEAHRTGTKVYALYRMNAEYGPPYDKLFNSRFWREHPQFRVVTSPEGQTSSLLSYAFPEVRKYKLDLLREALQTYDVDGIHLEFLRNPPFFGYERPLADGFAKEFGRNIRSPDFKADATWYKYRARFMTDFVRESRTILRQVGLIKGKRLWLGARVDWSEYLRQGLDVETWIKEGLIDMLAAGMDGLGYPYAPADEFVQMAKGTACKIYGSTSPEGAGYRDPTPEDDKSGYRCYPKSTSASLDMRRRRYLEHFKRGAQGMYLFNDGSRYLGEFNHLQRWGEFEDPLGFHVEPIKLASPPSIN